MHCHGWWSIYCIHARPAFKGSAPINLSDRLHQVLRWALESVETLPCLVWIWRGFEMVGEVVLYKCNHIPLDIHIFGGILYLANYMLAY